MVKEKVSKKDVLKLGTVILTNLSNAREQKYFSKTFDVEYLGTTYAVTISKKNNEVKEVLNMEYIQQVDSEYVIKNGELKLTKDLVENWDRLSEEERTGWFTTKVVSKLVADKPIDSIF